MNLLTPEDIVELVHINRELLETVREQQAHIASLSEIAKQLIGHVRLLD